ncbi:AAC(3) family N-acetyltransferase [Cohnella ginsengisoli]|uniref:Aminoglycoside N(3)-acetyltransferase n=1 Tax=Cohnella ginsengisoli TaxID=425004 RepID=A0A9X4KI63_9BACL|nr:AAC(3) family N-acetyltransferase [Cohnella ginsengisoli]MDG0792445.1 AAC(3) family N-acetyltransferase [Cohnella ginsengisoli]
MIAAEELQRQLGEGGIKSGQHLIVHASLSSLGFVVGGAETLVRALLALVGEEGTIMMPAQTWKNLDPSTGVHGDVPPAWWPAIRAGWPAYDKRIAPAIGMGASAEMLRCWPGARRSDHPVRSFAAVGRQADYLTANHDLSNIFGEDSPLDRLYRLGGRILLIGVGHDKNTSLHLAETRARFEGKRLVEESSAVLIDGRREWVTYPTQEVHDGDFARLGLAYEREHRSPIHGVGSAAVRLLEMRPFVDWAVDWMERHRPGSLPGSDLG